jgi:hypothetical protein
MIQTLNLQMQRISPSKTQKTFAMIPCCCPGIGEILENLIGRGDQPAWILYAESRGADIAVDINAGQYIFLYLALP